MKTTSDKVQSKIHEPKAKLGGKPDEVSPTDNFVRAELSSSSKDVPIKSHDIVSSSSASASQPVFFEVFEGCCQLSLSMEHAGFRAVPVDSQRNTHTPRRQVLILDLNIEADRCTLIDLINSSHTTAVHVALPCGTGSRARERPIPRHLIRQGAPAPVPLRSAEHLLGIPGLSEINSQRVELANQLADFTVELIELAGINGFFMSIQNPENSWMWGCCVISPKPENPPPFRNSGMQ